MFAEHIIYSLAIAIMATFFICRENAGWCTLIVVISACIPDLDGIIDLVQNHLVYTTGQLLPNMTEHSRYFHTIGALVIFALLAGLLIRHLYKLEFFSAALFAGIGFGAHLLEDALVYNPASAIFWPISPAQVGIGLFPDYSRDFFWIANTEVLLLGFVFLALAAGASLLIRRTEWTTVAQSPGQAYFFLVNCLVSK
jgi:membrane-bound metal-dependent hydrolase YbcI (DUF457 family)